MRTYCGLLWLMLLAGCGDRAQDQHPITAADTTAAVKKADTLIKPVKAMLLTHVLIGDSMYYTGRDACLLRGRLIQKLFYGSPNFGMSEESKKTDDRLTFFVLILDRPITLFPDYIDDGHDTIYGIDSVQIEDQRGNPDLLANVGKKVTLKGVMIEAIYAWQNTPVTLDYQSVVK